MNSESATNGDTETADSSLVTKESSLKIRKKNIYQYGLKPSRRELCLLLVVIILLAFGVGMTCLYVLKPINTKGAVKEMDAKVKLCDTAKCVYTASDLLVGFDPSVDPCKDFFSYACGRWSLHNPIPQGKQKWHQFDKLSKSTNDYVRELITNKEIRAKYSNDSAVSKVFKFYDSCVDEAAIEKLDGAPLRKLIEKYGSWPLGNNSWNETGWDLVETIGTIGRDLGTYPLVVFSVQSDRKNSMRNLITLQQLWYFSLSKYHLLRNNTRARKVKRVFKEMMRNITVALGAVNVTDTEIDDIIKFEEKLAKITVPRVRSDYYRNYKKMTLRELNEKTGYKFDWLAFLQTIFAKTNYTVSEDEEIGVFALQYMKNLTNLLSETPKRSIANYVMWRVVATKYHSLSKKFQNFYKSYTLQLYNRWGGVLKRKELCIFELQFLAWNGMPLAKVYVDRKFSGNKRKQAKKIMDDVRAAFIENLENIDWMEESSKNLARAKAEGMVEHIGYPDYLRDREKLNKRYEKVECFPKRYFDNEVSFNMIKNLNDLNKMGKPVDRDEWTFLPSGVNALYYPTLNKILFPAAVLQPPLYNKDYLSAVNYGGIGGIMAHELVHGFDDVGKDFDVFGNNVKWWDDKTLAEFNNRTQCFVKQMSNFTFYGYKLKGKRTLSEDLADNGALKISFLAYQNWVKENGVEPRLPGMKLTNEQVFFISFAKNWCSVYTPLGARQAVSWPTHSPLPWRVNGTMRNFPQFAEAFKCPAGSPMNPRHRCQLW